ncbi:plancitoxin-1 [Musca domestica]|uniref:Plancitoxin-1 n=1 Tax=Musca domestica TaxID=7370 RepID=A0A9J7CI25_MUSDO|nr:plancitoxin-1 [Musca domestica]
MLKQIKDIFLLLLIFLIPNGTESKISCKDEKGQDVDWFYLYKLPMHYAAKNSTKPRDSAGLNYLYMTSKSYDNWSLSPKQINESSSMAGLTLEPLFANDSILLLAYNDEFPNGTVIFSGGHAKGVVASDGVTGLWLIHSVPKFPNTTKYEYPSTGCHYGQSFLCVTLPASEMEKVAEQLLFNEPNIYHHKITKELMEQFPTFEKVLQKDWIKTEPFNNVLNLITLEGKTFKSFAKSSQFNQELYEDFVAPTLDTNLLVETWRNGGGNLQSNCTRNDKVYNIQKIEEENFGLDFKTTQDHSKWAVSQSVGLKFWRWRFRSTSNWICVGDINRQQHQLVRGGGVLCQQNSKISKLYRGLVKEYESCSKKD